MDTIVVGVDDSEGARAALAWAARHAATTGAGLRVVHAYDLNIAWIDVYSDAIPRWEERARAAADQLLERLVDEVPGVSELDSVELRAVEGYPVEVLHGQARDGSLVVVGTRGRGGFKGLLLGSVSQGVAQHSPCPVVIVPPPQTGAEQAVAAAS